MSKISKHIRDKLANDKFMRRCILAESRDQCRGKVEWHHVWKYAGKQIQEVFAIIPLCTRHHEYEYRFRDLIKGVSLSRATPQELLRYPKIDWEAEKEKYEKDTAAF